MSVQYLKKEELFPKAIEELQPAEIALDIGCGIRPQELIKPRVHICFDAVADYLAEIKTRQTAYRDRSYIFLKGTWDQVVELFPEKSVDTVFLLDVIEHLEKAEGEKLLKKTEAITRNQIVIFTPLGFMAQHHENGKDAWGFNHAGWQEHRSGWVAEDFDDSWKILICQEYHETNNAGHELEKAHGALFAIKNMAHPSIVSINESPEFIMNALNAECDKLSRELALTKETLNNIYTSRGWRVSRFLSSLFHRLPLIRNP